MMVTPLTAQGPMAILQSIHNAFRRDVVEIDDLAYQAAAQGGDIQPVLDRLEVFFTMLDIHTRGEDAVLFPVVDRVAPLLAGTYRADHDDAEGLRAAIVRMGQNPDLLAIARATAALRAHTLLHLQKEDELLLPVIQDRTGRDEQMQILAFMGRGAPPELALRVVAWMFGLTDHDDRETIATVWMQTMPAPAFAAMRALIRETLKADWNELVRRVPNLISR
jgi:iron-sulfur cluster repair protein YtfE (RIC family)